MKPTVAAKNPSAIELEEGKRYYFCTCGKSASQPFCDGAHKGSGFAPQPFVAEKSGTAYLCQCKQSENLPFCDGRHKLVPDEEVGNEFSVEG